MESALRLVSWHGHERDQVRALDIRSQADARKLAPFIDDGRKPVCWVNWSKPRKTTNKKTLPHFRRLVFSRFARKSFQSLDEELVQKQKLSESKVHKLAKERLCEHLKNKLLAGQPYEWAFKDERVSAFSLVGNLLAGVEEIVTEYSYETCFGFEYKFDIALLGPVLGGERLLLGAIEIEKENRVGMLKCLVCKALGFPMVCVNIEDLTDEDITDAWIARSLKETKSNSTDGLRRNYVYVHNALYPVYLNIPAGVRGGTKHQYVIFCKEEDFELLGKRITECKNWLELDNASVSIDRPRLNADNATSRKMFSNEGSVAGSDWPSYNNEHYLRLTLDVPLAKSGSIYLFHLLLSRVLNAEFDTIAGYKYAPGVRNENADDAFWRTGSLFNDGDQIAPKQLSEHIKPIIDFLREHGIYRDSSKSKKSPERRMRPDEFVVESEAGISR